MSHTFPCLIAVLFRITQYDLYNPRYLDTLQVSMLLVSMLARFRFDAHPTESLKKTKPKEERRRGYHLKKKRKETVEPMYWN